MSDSELRTAYQQALRAYEAAKAGDGDRVRTFVEFLSAERALASQGDRSAQPGKRMVRPESSGAAKPDPSLP
jgi:hypothetical protein